MNVRLRHVLWGGAALLAGAFVVGWSGLVGIGASSGHWELTNLVLHWGMEQSVETAALSVDEPDDLDDPALVRRAAGHFETSCAFCHGSPARDRRALPQQMTPPPPLLIHSAEKWSPAELFVIVKHGVKFSGMPAWISLARDDEVWAMVSFLRALSRMDEATYLDLAFGQARSAGSSDPVLEGCIRCHGRDGGSDGGAFPVIAGQRPVYLRETLQAFSMGRRASGIMQFATAALSPEQLGRVADHFAGLPRPGNAAGVDATLAERGRAIAERGLPEARVPACRSCHRSDDGGKPVFPVLDGQEAWYLVAQLRLWKDHARGGTPYAHLMEKVVTGLTEADIQAVAAYFASSGRLARTAADR
jgi:cytochrome c553